MATKKTTKAEMPEDFVSDSLVQANEANQPTKEAVTFSPEQMEVINRLIAAQGGKSNSPTSVSVYNKRDIKKIETVNVSRFEGKFVLGFKNLQKDPFVKEPKYYEEKLDIVRKLANQPFVILLLSEDGKEIEEREVALVDYVNNRKKFKADVVSIDKEEIIKDHGLLGRSGGSFANMSDEKGKAVEQIAVRAESKELVMKFYVKLPGFEKPVEFISDFLA